MEGSDELTKMISELIRKECGTCSQCSEHDFTAMVVPDHLLCSKPGLLFISFNKVMQSISAERKSDNLNPCTVALCNELLHRLVTRASVGMDNNDVAVDFRREMISNDNIKPDIIATCKLLLELPSLVFPLTDSSGDDEVVYLTRHAQFYSQCLTFYMNILKLYSEDLPAVTIENGLTNISLSDSDDGMAIKMTHNYSIVLVKHTVVLGVLACTRHMGSFGWSSVQSRELSSKLMRYYLHYTNHSTIQSLISGVSNSTHSDDPQHRLFEQGIFRSLLIHFRKMFSKEKWKEDKSTKHTFMWCLTKVHYPLLGEHVPSVVPALLLMVDDWQVENKRLGIVGLRFLIENVLPTDLSMHNYHQVIFDALMKQLYTNEDGILEVTLPCLLRILLVLKHAPARVDGVEYDAWDLVCEKLLTNADCEHRSSTRRILLEFLTQLVSYMGGNVIKHFSRIMRIIPLYLTFNYGNEHKIHAHTLDLLFESALVCWPVIHKEQDNILKVLLKFMIDLNVAVDDSSLDTSSKHELESRMLRVLALLRKSGGETFSTKLSLLIEQANVNGRFQPIIETLQSALKINLESYDFQLHTNLPLWLK